MSTCSHLKDLNIAIVGGSIAGHLNALSLLRLGAKVTIFERSSKSSFEDRGVGIGVPTSVVDSVKSMGYFCEDVKHDHCPSFKRIVPSPDHPADGRLIWKQPVALELMSWSEIFRQFLGQIPNGNLLYNSKILDVGMNNEKAFVSIEGEAESREFDLVIGADGYLSTTRKFVSPSVPTPAGYVLWRGSMPEEALTHLNLHAPCLDEFSFIFLPGCGGHVAFYYVTKPSGERVLTWGQYIPVPIEEFSRVMTDVNGIEHTHSLPAGAVQPDLVEEWKAKALEFMPSNYSAVIAASENTFIQGIFDVDLNSLVRGRVVLTGDAGFVARPHTVAGFSKAFENATALAHALESFPTVDEALDDYNNSQLSTMHKAVTLGEQLGQGTVLGVPQELASWDEDQLKAWLTSLTDVGGKLNVYTDSQNK